MSICARLEVTPTITRVQLLLTDNLACVLDEADKISLASQLTIILARLKWSWLVPTALIPAFIIVNRRGEDLHRRGMRNVVSGDFFEV